jgi:hypothetical protein
VPVEPFYLEGRKIDLHAERRIKEAYARDSGKALNSQFLAGTMRPCGICAKDLDLPPSVHRGPFWLSRAGQAFYNAHEVVEENVARSVGTYASAGTGVNPSVNYNTDSDSEAEDGVRSKGKAKRKAPSEHPEAHTDGVEALSQWSNRRKRSARGQPPEARASTSRARAKGKAPIED